MKNILKLSLATIILTSSLAWADSVPTSATNAGVSTAACQDAGICQNMFAAGVQNLSDYTTTPLKKNSPKSDNESDR